MSSNNRWEEICAEVQKRSLESTSLQWKGSHKQFWSEIFKCLISASDDKVLKNRQDEIRKLLKIVSSQVVLEKGYSDIVGGEKNQKRDKSKPHFERHDGCWFDFAIIISPTEIIAFDFEIRFPDGYSPSYLRFDLNRPGHDNEKRDIRFHMHPGNEDIQIHSPPMTPLEILHLFLYGLELPKKPRSS